MKTPCVTLIACITGLAVLAPLQTGATDIVATKMFEDAACAGPPTAVLLEAQASCADHTLNTCTVSEGSNVMFSCADSYVPFAKAAFDESPYFIMQVFAEDTDCGSMKGVSAFLADSKRRVVKFDGQDTSMKVELDANGTVTYTIYKDNESLVAHFAEQYTSDQMNTDKCERNYLKLYTGNTPTVATTESSTASVRFPPMSAQIALLVMGLMLVVL